MKSISKAFAKGVAYALKPMLLCVYQSAKLVLKVLLWLLKGLIKLIETVVRSLMVGLDIAVAFVVFGIEKCFFCSRKSNYSACVPAHSYAHSVQASEVSAFSCSHGHSAEANEDLASRGAYSLHGSKVPCKGKR